MSEQQLQLIDSNPRPGELWECMGNIAYVVQVGAEEFYGKLPNYIVWVSLGMCNPFSPGRWWDIDYMDCEISIDKGFLSNLPHGCDKLYLHPWSGQGVFFGTPDAQRMADLISRWQQIRPIARCENGIMTKEVRSAKDEDEEIRIEMRAICSKRVAPKGFR